VSDLTTPAVAADLPSAPPSNRVAPAPLDVDASVGDAVAELAAARAALGEEVGALVASTRAALDIKARIRRSPAKAAAVVGGATFVAVGGPRRVLRAVKRRVVGEPDPLPPSLLPDEVEKAVRALGDDGAKVRGALERGFAGWLDATAKDRKAESRQRSLVNLAMKIGRPVATKAARQALDGMLREPGEAGDRAAAKRRADAARGGADAATPARPARRSAGRPSG
jgi:hypothetical protein